MVLRILFVPYRSKRYIHVSCCYNARLLALSSMYPGNTKLDNGNSLRKMNRHIMEALSNAIATFAVCIQRNGPTHWCNIQSRLPMLLLSKLYLGLHHSARQEK